MNRVDVGDVGMGKEREWMCFYFCRYIGACRPCNGRRVELPVTAP